MQRCFTEFYLIVLLSAKRLTAIWLVLSAAPVFAQEPPPAPATSDIDFALDGRLRYELNDPAAFGNGPQDGGGYLLWRVIPSVRIDVAPDWSATVEVFAAGVTGRDGGARPNDRNDFDLTQAHVEWRPGGGNSFVRIGRQEIALGSGRLLAANDGANIRRRFDGVLGQWQSGQWTGIAVAATIVQVRPGVFDDGGSTDRLMLGGGIVHGDLAGSSEALYTLRTRDSTPRFGSPPGKLERYTIGGRFVRRRGALLVEGEAIGQLGSTDQGKAIRAWAIAGDVHGELAQIGAAALIGGAKISVASGDENPADQTIGGFDPLFPNPAFTGSFPLFAPTNIAAVNPALSLQWPRGHRIGVDVALMQRVTQGDSVYNFGGAAVGSTGGGRYVGALWALTGVYRVSPQLSVNATASYLANGNYFARQERNTTAIFVNLNLEL
jgi:hypothetical protein